MFIGDSRRGDGPGILPLQHENYEAGEWPLWNRSSILAVRLVGRFDNDGGTSDGSDLGWWEEDPETRGDVIGGMNWPRSSREISAWRFAWPVNTTEEQGDAAETGDQSRPRGSAGNAGDKPKAIQAGKVGGGSKQKNAGKITVKFVPPPNKKKPNVPGSKEAGGAKGSDGARVPTSSAGGGGCEELTDEHVIPVRRDDWSNDDRFETIEYQSPEDDDGKRLWPKFPYDWKGIVLQADHEDEQEELFYPTDPRLLAVHCHGDKEMGSLVCDMAAGFKVDANRMARLQSAFRVTPKVSGCAVNSTEPIIAWNIGDTGCKEGLGGLIWEQDSGAAGGSTVDGNANTRPTTGAPGTKDPNTSVSVSRFGSTDSGGGGGGGGSSTTTGGGGCPSGVMGHVSQRRSGPLELDCNGNHRIGSDEDGNPIFSAHLSLNSYFTFPGGTFDGPLAHNGKWRKDPDEAPFDTFVFFEYDDSLPHPFVCGARLGKHRWRSQAWRFWTSNPPPQTPGGPITDAPPATPPGSPLSPPLPPGDGYRDPIGDGLERPGGEGWRPQGSSRPFAPGDTVMGPYTGGPLGPQPVDYPGPNIPGDGPWPTTPTTNNPNNGPNGSLDWSKIPTPSGLHPGDPFGPGGLFGPPGHATIETFRGDRRPRPVSIPGTEDVISFHARNDESVRQQFVDRAGKAYPLITPWHPGVTFPFAGTTLTEAIPGLLGRPQNVAPSEPDLRHCQAPPPEIVDQVKTSTPVTWRMDTFGQQTGPDWTYTDEPRTKYPGGTANGGVIFDSPCSDWFAGQLGHPDQPTSNPTSTASFVIGSSARFGFGAADATSGGINGASIGFSDNHLTFNQAVGSTDTAMALIGTITGQVRAANTAGFSLPGHSFIGDQTTGMARDTALGIELGLVVDGAPRVIMDTAAGGANVGINGPIGGSFFGMSGGLFIADGSAPSILPFGGGCMYVDAGSLKWKGSAGTITTIAVA